MKQVTKELIKDLTVDGVTFRKGLTLLWNKIENKSIWMGIDERLIHEGVKKFVLTVDNKTLKKMKEYFI